MSYIYNIIYNIDEQCTSMKNYAALYHNPCRLISVHCGLLMPLKAWALYVVHKLSKHVLVGQTCGNKIVTRATVRLKNNLYKKWRIPGPTIKLLPLLTLWEESW